uniref:Uncharacterized protein n=1 Tax=Arundo donax TaxID=35708 RepID=A0A0A9CCC9_ARUDO
MLGTPSQCTQESKYSSSFY